MSHTPGPWTISHAPDNSRAVSGPYPGGGYAPVCRAEGYFDLETRTANLTLIAAAPEMLALLQEIDRQCTLGTGTQEHIRAVIAKATGA